MKKYIKGIAGIRHKLLADGEIEIVLVLEHGEEFVMYAHRYHHEVPPDIPYRLPGFDFRIKPDAPMTLTYDPLDPKTAHICGSHTDWVNLYGFCASVDDAARQDEFQCAHADIAEECTACYELEVHLGWAEKAEEDNDEATVFWLERGRESRYCIDEVALLLEESH